MITHTYLNNYPENHQSDWTNDLQGVTHDSEYWYFTQKTKLFKFHITTDLTEGSASAAFITKMPDELASLGCNHFGDLDHFEVDGQGYLFVPVENEDLEKRCGEQTFLAVFRNDDDITYVGSAELSSQKKSMNTARAGWCAINPVNKLLHSSSNEIRKDFPVFRYKIDFEALLNGNVILTPAEDLILFDNDEIPKPIHIPKHVQGGAFSPGGHLYIANGGKSEDENGGIRVFDLNGILQDHSSLTELPFKYEFDSNSLLGPYQEPEGLTYWDVDVLRRRLNIPVIEGQLHAILLDNDLLSKDDIYFKHYRVSSSNEENSAPSIGLSTTNISFGSVSQRDVKTRVLTIFNLGSTSLSISITPSSPPPSGQPLSGFFWGSFSAQILSNQSRDFLINFTPRAEGQFAGNLSIVSNTLDSPHRVNLSGKGLSADIQPL